MANPTITTRTPRFVASVLAIIAAACEVRYLLGGNASRPVCLHRQHLPVPRSTRCVPLRSASRDLFVASAGARTLRTGVNRLLRFTFLRSGIDRESDHHRAER